MCCEPVNGDSPVTGQCEHCGGPIDIDGDSTEVCGYSPVDCEVCGHAPCDDSC